MGSSRPARMLSAVSQLSPVIAGLSPSGQPCGELTCGPKEFCHVSTFGCRPCTDVCSPGHKNFQQSTCFAQCQGEDALRCGGGCAGGGGSSTPEEKMYVEIYVVRASWLACLVVALFLFSGFVYVFYVYVLMVKMKIKASCVNLFYRVDTRCCPVVWCTLSHSF